LGVGLAVAVGIINGIWYELQTTDDPDAEDPYKP
ncbi:MAG: CydX/CbdX family cytochrome bd oxidase small subunit, partial [Asticcacaulis sp.]|nr:CydX/CbdX family cytochrome bd oxidase small subunit [Asticcacaulis sp.]